MKFEFVIILWDEKKCSFILEELGDRLRDVHFQVANRVSEHAFTRVRVFTFDLVMIAILNRLSKSLNIELTKFLQHFCPGKMGSKQAFSKARYGIRWQAFEELTREFMTNFYEYEPETVRLWKNNWLVLATDGSDYELPWESSLRDEFGVADNGQGKKPMCMAKGVKIYDILNHMTVSAELGGYHPAELTHFKAAWGKAHALLEKAAPTCRRLLLGDRHYPAFWLIHQLEAEKTDFLFRCRPNFCREITEFMSTGLLETELTVPISSDTFRKHCWRKQTKSNPPEHIRFRILRDDAPDETPYCLITNLTQQEASRQELLELYPERWGEEVSFFFDKTRFEVENFAALKPEGIRQEWFAQILAANMAQLFIQDAQDILDEEQSKKNNKHQYQINKAAAIGILKDELPKLISRAETHEKFYERILPLILANREPVRKNRSFERKRKHKLKFSKNLRKVL